MHDNNQSTMHSPKQNVHDPEASTSGTLMFFSFVIVVIAALMARIYYHCHRKRRSGGESNPLANVPNHILSAPMRVQSASNSTSLNCKWQRQRTIYPVNGSLNDMRIIRRCHLAFNCFGWMLDKCCTLDPSQSQDSIWTQIQSKRIELLSKSLTLTSTC